MIAVPSSVRARRDQAENELWEAGRRQSETLQRHGDQPPSPLTRNEIRPISDREFALFQGLIHRLAGIHLVPAKKALLVRRLTRRLRELSLTSFTAYYRLAKQPGHEEQIEMLDRICTNETQFFRESKQFDLLAEEIIPQWNASAAAGNRPRRLRAWSVACSSGEEPFSLAMTLLHHLTPEAAWQVEVQATDLSTRVLATARKAIWPIERAKRIPEVLRRRFMLKGVRSQFGKVKATRKIRSVVHFDRLNLNAENYTVRGPFDLIFCRNVLIYFDPQTRRRVIGQLLKRLAPNGFLFMGHAENLNGLTEQMRSVIPCVYTRTNP